MQWHKIVAWVILPILLDISFTLAAPVLLRETREVAIEVVDAARDVTAVLQKRRNPTDEWSTTVADPGPGVHAPSPDPDSLPRPEIMPPGPQGLDPIDVGPSHSIQGSTEWDYHPSPSPPPVDSPLPVDDSLAPTLGGYDFLGLMDTPPAPGPAHNNVPLNIDLNDPYQSGPGPTDQDKSHPLPMSSLRPPTHNELSMEVDLHAPHQLSPWPSDQDGSHLLALGLAPPGHNKSPLDIGSNAYPQEPMDSPNSNPKQADFELWWQTVTKLRPYVDWKSLHTFPSSQPKSPPALGHDNLGDVLYRPLSNPGPGQIDDQPTPEAPPLHPGSLKRPLEDPLSNQGLPKRPEPDAPLDVEPLRWAYPSPDRDPSIWAYPQSNLESSTWLDPQVLQDPGPSTLAHDPGPSTWAHDLSFPGPSTWLYPPSSPQPSTLARPSPDPTWLYPLPPDPGSPTWLYPPLDPGPSTWFYPPMDPVPPILAHPQPDPGPPTLAHPQPDPGPSTLARPPTDPGSPTLARPPDPGSPTLARPPDPGSPTLAHPLGSSTEPDPPPGPESSALAHPPGSSTWSYPELPPWVNPPRDFGFPISWLYPELPTWVNPPPDPGSPTVAQPPPDPEPSAPEAPSRSPVRPQPEHKIATSFDDLITGRFKRRRLFGSRPASAEGVDPVEG